MSGILSGNQSDPVSCLDSIRVHVRDCDFPFMSNYRILHQVFQVGFYFTHLNLADSIEQKQ